jgi:1-acyl-sn-glycerol-3-phosphate acyltransferase
MLTLDVLDSIKLSKKPWGQIAVASSFLMPNYRLPPSKTEIRFEGAEHIVADRPVIYAMNHTDRYNYWPFQYRLWREYGQYTTTWVKGKYYNKAPIRAFMIKMNNLAVPSRGYLITADAAQVLGHAPKDKTYRILRRAIDANITDTRQVRQEAADEGVLSEVVPILDTARDMLGMYFDPNSHNYLEAMYELFAKMMERFVELNEEALDMGLNILVFPEGTRSKRLSDGKPGLAQMALRMNATVVPVGCNGSDELYPGDSPLSKGGEVLYRIGEPLTPDGALSEFRIDEHFTPFTHDAEERYGEVFAEMTELVMDRINELLDPKYKRDGHEDVITGTKRFI